MTITVDFDTLEAVQAFYVECPKCGDTVLTEEVCYDNECLDCGCTWIIKE